MKKLITSVIVVLGALSACTVQNQGVSYDEVYDSPKDQPVYTPAKGPAKQKASRELMTRTDSTYLGRTVSLADGRDSLKDGEAYVADNNYNKNFNYDDYYDYSYASRIRRFQYGYFNDYYNDFYTNRYWYDYNPWYFGTSIYSGWGMNFGFYSPYSYWGIYSPYYSPFYSPYSAYYDPFYSGFGGWGMYGWNPYWYGYNNGFYNGYYYGYYGNGGYAYGGGYGNNLDRNSSYYYGPRRESSSSNGPIPSERTAFSQRYNAMSTSGGGATSVSAPRNGREMINNNNGSTVVNGQGKVANAGVVSGSQREVGGSNLFGAGGGNQRVSSPATAREGLNRSDVNRYVSDPQARGNVQTTQPQDRYYKDKSTSMPNPRVNSFRENNNQRYVKPENGTQQYYSPSNARPRSSNEYTSPSYRSPAEYNSRQVAPQRSVSDPQRYAPPRVYQAPSNSYRPSSSGYTPSSYSGSESRSYSAPSSSPSSSPSSYSSPSSSYSAPAGNARESGSGSSSPSSSPSTSTGPRR